MYMYIRHVPWSMRLQVPHLISCISGGPELAWRIVLLSYSPGWQDAVDRFLPVTPHPIIILQCIPPWYYGNQDELHRMSTECIQKNSTATSACNVEKKVVGHHRTCVSGLWSQRRQVSLDMTDYIQFMHRYIE